MNIIVRQAQECDLNEITNVHMLCFEDYFSSKLGSKLLKNFYYEYYLKFPELFLVAYDPTNKKIIGFTNGYIIGQNIRNAFIQKNFFPLLLQGISLLLRLDKTAWKKVFSVFKRKKSDPCAPKTKDGEGDLLSICVLPSYRGTTAATLMVNMFEESLKKLQIDTYYLTVYAENARANSFYQKIGMSIFYQSEADIKYKKTFS